MQFVVGGEAALQACTAGSLERAALELPPKKEFHPRA
jgi:hypothetical protein